MVDLLPMFDGEMIVQHMHSMVCFVCMLQYYKSVTEEAVQKWGGYINFQDTLTWSNLQSYAGLVKSGGAQPPYSTTYAKNC